MSTGITAGAARGVGICTMGITADPLGFLLSDSDRTLVLALAYILYKQGADKTLLLALLYIAFDFRISL